MLAALAATSLAGCGPGSEGSRTSATDDGTGTAPRAKAKSVAPSGPEPATPPAETSYAPWPMALHDPRHSASSPVEGPTKGRIAWRRRLEGPVVPGPVVGKGGVAYAASNGGVLHALRVWIERFETFEQLRARVRRFARDYNAHWLLERHGYRTPTEARAHLAALAHAAVA